MGVPPCKAFIYLVILTYFAGNLPDLQEERASFVYLRCANNSKTIKRVPFQWQELQYVEFFAGEAEVFTAVHAGRRPSVAVDISYLQSAFGNSANAFDINSRAGLMQLGYRHSAPQCVMTFFRIKYKIKDLRLAFAELPSWRAFSAFWDSLLFVGARQLWHLPEITSLSTRQCLFGLHPGGQQNDIPDTWSIQA